MRLLLNETATYDLTACFHILFRLDLHPNQSYLHTQYLIHHHSRSENHNLLKLQNVIKFVICIQKEDIPKCIDNKIDVLLIYLKLFEWQLGQPLFVASFDFVFCSIALQVSLPDKDGKSLDRMELKENGIEVVALRRDWLSSLNHIVYTYMNTIAYLRLGTVDAIGDNVVVDAEQSLICSKSIDFLIHLSSCILK